MQFGIVSARNPGHAAAVAHGVFVGPGFRAGIAFLDRLAPPLPLQVAGFRIVRFQESGHIQRITTCAYQNMVSDDDRRGRGEVLLLHVGDFFVPALLTGLASSDTR